MKFLVSSLLLLSLGFCSCTDNNSSEEIDCSENGCTGNYKGEEFIHSEDIAHQFSNKMSRAVGEELKDLYEHGNYKKVDLNSIKMTTEGMGSGQVTYSLIVPFTSVHSKCDAYTSFDHAGGWGHSPELEKRKEALKEVTIEGQELDISDLKTTPEGLQEYWIQWKNKDLQSECK